MRTRRRGFLTEGEKKRLWSNPDDRKNNYLIRNKARNALNDLKFICEYLSITQLDKIFSEFLYQAMLEKNQASIAGFGYILQRIIDICFYKGRKMIDEKFQLDRSLLLTKYENGAWSPEVDDMLAEVEPFFTNERTWDEEFRNAELIIHTQILSAMKNALKKEGIIFSWDFTSDESIRKARETIGDTKAV